jgi:uncharacterized membrane protein
MTEPKSTADDYPDEEAPAYDEPPAAPGDPLFEDDETPEGPEEPEPLEPGAPEDAGDEPVQGVLPGLEPQPEPEAEPEPELEAEPETAFEAAAPERDFEPEAVAEATLPEPEPEPEPDRAADAAAAEPEVGADEPRSLEEARIASAEAAIDDPHHDIFGPEPWDQATPAPVMAQPEPLPEPVPDPALAAVAAPVPVGRAAPTPSPREPQAAPAADALPGAGASNAVKRSAFAVYLMYLAALVVVGIPLIAGVWLAYEARRDAPKWLHSHYTYQIRTFWICIGGLALAGLVLFLPFALFPLTIVAVVVWLVTRCFFGLVRLNRGEPIYNPQTWIV